MKFYLDDVLIYSANVEEHIKLLGKLFRKFKGVPLNQNLLRLSERQDPAPAGSKGLLGQTPSAAGSCC